MIPFLKTIALSDTKTLNAKKKKKDAQISIIFLIEFTYTLWLLGFFAAALVTQIRFF